jgi:hypothetical protein
MIRSGVVNEQARKEIQATGRTALGRVPAVVGATARDIDDA